MRIVAFLALLVALAIGSAPGFAAPLAQTIQGDNGMPLGTISGGHIENVPLGNLYIDVADITLKPGGFSEFTIPDASMFLVNDDQPLQVNKEMKPYEAVFLAPNIAHAVQNNGAKPARYRIISMGAKGALVSRGLGDDPSLLRYTAYEMEPLPWGPQAGHAYDVTIDRGPFGANSATPWHIHTGPAFGVLDGGTWENRLVGGKVTRIPTPGYYVIAAGVSHQLAQVGTSGYALIIQFFPPRQGKTTSGPERAASQPTVLSMATAIPTAAPVTPSSQQSTMRATAITVGAGITVTPGASNRGIVAVTETAPPLAQNTTATAPTMTPIKTPTLDVAVERPGATVSATPAVIPTRATSGSNGPLVTVIVAGAAAVAAMSGLAGAFARRKRVQR